MRISSNRYRSVMDFGLKELKDLYTENEIKTLIYYLFEEYLGLNKTDYILNANKGMSESELLKFNFAIKDLKHGKPLQHILGYAYFGELKLFVNNLTLIPRPETEELVQLIIQSERDHSDLKIIDIGTGTACIPISLALSMPQHQYTAIDFKDEIITLAKKNAKKYDVEILFQTIDILNITEKELHTFDVIISNPPYVLESEKQKMHINVLKHEPSSALYVDDDQSMIFYEKIAFLASKKLRPNGRLYFEINETKGEEIKSLLQKMNFKNIVIVQDIHGKNRFVKANYLV